MNSRRLAAWLIILTIITFILVIGKDLLIPLVLAITIWYVINTLARQFRRVKIGNWRLSKPVSVGIASVVIIGLLVVAIEIIVRSIENMVAAAPAYQKNLEKLVQGLMDYLEMDHLPSITQVLEEFDISPVVSDLGASVSGFAGSLFMVMLYLVFLLIEQNVFPLKFEALFPSEMRNKRMKRTLNRINGSIRMYIGIKTLTSLMTGVLSYLVMEAVGLDFATFWAFLIFLMNYIPTVGSIVATSFPALFALIQFDGFTQFFIIFFGIGTLQMLIGSLLEPRLMGNSLNISALVVLLSLGIWGSIWGITGMVLSSPITVSAILILAEFEKTRPIAVLLSHNGQVGENLREEKRFNLDRDPGRE